MSADDKTKEALFARAVTDPEFRAQLLADPEGTIKAGGYEIDEDSLEMIKSFDADAAEAAAKSAGGGLDARRARLSAPALPHIGQEPRVVSLPAEAPHAPSLAVQPGRGWILLLEARA